jgi:hypothetical protein
MSENKENSLVDIMKQNDIELEWLFTFARYSDHEGLIYFEPIVETISKQEEEIEVMDLKPQCLIIDGAKFVYDEEMDSKIVIGAINNIVTLTRIDGVQINIDTRTIEDFPFATTTISSKISDVSVQKPQGFVEVE